MFSSTFLFLSATLLPSVFAATAEQWRGRSIYQIITDRYALPQGADTSACNPGAQTWCGGTWNTIRENLDYIQNAGFTAIWISPVNQNYEGPRTPYGDPYHGYWMADVTKLNNRFGTADDLKALSTELHKRDMFLMVDIVVNNVMATSTNPDYSKYLFKDKTYYHSYCPIKWGDINSEKNCWMGDEKVPLPDLNTQDPDVISVYNAWIKDFVQEYSIDGLRIDAAKHTNTDFWPQFCGAAGVFCMGEVFGDDIDAAASYQGPNALDSILNYPLYTALVDAFKIPGPQNASAIADVLDQSKKKFKDLTLLGNFLENQDLPRWHNQSVDPQSLYNAMTFNFMSDGIPIVYYGQEQSFSGASDPWNREAMWTSSYKKSTAYNLIATLNLFRNHLVKTDWLTSPAEVLTVSPYGIAIMKGPVISILTNIGSPAQNGTSIVVHSPYAASTATTNILTCQQWAVGSSGMLDVEYTKGGQPVILVPTTVLDGTGICEVGGSSAQSTGQKSSLADSNAASTSAGLPRALFISAFSAILLFLCAL